MTPPLPACKISQRAYGPKKLEQAMEHVEMMTDKERRAKKGSLDAFLAKKTDIDAKSMDPVELLARFHVHQVEARGTYKSSNSAHSIGKSKKKIDILRWWNRERMDKKLGPIYSGHVRSSRLLACRPNKLTKSTHPDHVEYGCAEDMEQLEEHQIRELKMLAEAEMTPEDLNAFEDIADDLAC